MSPVHTRTNGGSRHHHLLRRHIYYKPKSKKRGENRNSASEIAKMIRRGRVSSSRPSTHVQNVQNQPAANLRRSLRKRRPASHGEYISYSDNEDDFELRRPYRQPSRGRNDVKSSQEDDQPLPRREGLRPRRATRRLRPASPESSEDDEEQSSEDNGDEEEKDREEVEENEEEEEQEGREDDEDEEEEEEDEEDEEREGGRRYALRNRTEVQRFSPRHEERPLHSQRSLSKSFAFQTGVKRNREGKRTNSKADKRHRSSRAYDSDDSLLIDEIVQSQSTPWLKGGSMGAQSWHSSGFDLLGFQNRGMNAVGNFMGSQSDQLASGIPTAGLSHKGGADIQPLQVDDSVTFDQVGGLSDYVQSLKEIVFFPLLYPQFFQNYGIKPPRGVLLCGPPGTGKTLIARALAASATRAGKKINFYMRKGADVLSKWVGEAERQLRMLFEEAQRNQPSIIFFDEIDGLAPVRSSKQEQIHNSIVSTLLALMDGLDALGQVIVIGATNRVDAIDSALRRPGRFDRELTFSLPDSKAREEILKIHTRSWKSHLNEDVCKELASACVGYCGADLKALCTEAAIGAFRKKYPQVYTSDDPLLVDVNAIQVKRLDFLEAMSTITPAAQRGTLVQSMPLSSIVHPCLENQLKYIMKSIGSIFPMHKMEGISKAHTNGTDQLAAFSTLRYGSSFPFVYRPRLLICGNETAGIEHVGPAVLHELEKFPVHSLSLPSLLSDMGSRSPEEAIVNIFRESRRTTPAVLYLPQMELWWDTAHTQLRAVLLMLLADLPSNLPVLFLATAKVSQAELEEQIANIFGASIYELEYPRSEDRAKFFSRLLETAMEISEHKYNQKNKPVTPPMLPKAPKIERERSEAELQAQVEEEEHSLRQMRMCLRDICNRLLYEKCFSVFHYPVTEDDAPDYREIIQTPMDISTLLQNTDSGKYLTRSSFLQDIDLIVLNAKAYHKDDYSGARIVSKACALRDTVHAMLSQIDKELVAQCDAISARGGPIKLNAKDSENTNEQPVMLLTNAPRVSARLRGVQPEIDLSQTPEVHARRSRRSIDGELGCMPTASDVGAAIISQAEALPKVTDEFTNPETKEESELPLSPSLYPLPNSDLETLKEVSMLKNEEDGNNTEEAPAPESPNLGANGPSDYCDQEECVKMDVDTDATMTDVPAASRIEKLKSRFVRRSKGLGVSDLEKLHATVCQEVRSDGNIENRMSALEAVERTVAGMKVKKVSAVT